MVVRLTVRGLLALAVTPVLGVASAVSADLPRSAPATAAPAPSAVDHRSAVTTGDAGRRHRHRWLLWRLFASAADGDPCTYSGPIAGKTALTVRIERLDALELCGEGFARGDRALLRFTGLGPTRWPGRDDTGGPGDRTWSWDAVEAAALFPRPGAYPFVVTVNGTVTGGGRVVVSRATAPDAVFAYPEPADDDGNRMRPGETLTITAAGYRPGAPIFASIYGEEREHRRPLLHDLPEVTADQFGEGVLTWTATSADKPGPRVAFVESPGDALACWFTKPQCSKFRIDPWAG